MALCILWGIFHEARSFRIGTLKPHFPLKIVISAYVRMAFLKALRMTLIMICGRNNQYLVISYFL